jgi:DNA-binding MarR family transcriptional regulator
MDPLMSATAAAPPASEPHPSTDDFVRLVQTFMRALHTNDVESLCAIDLTMPQLKTLFLAQSPAGVSHGEIARALGVGLSTVTGIVDRLVEHGLVERHAAPEDRRLSRVRATQAGSELLDGLWASRRERLMQVFAGLNADDRASLQAALQYLAELLGEQS